MIVALIAAAEVAFWVLLAAGLGFRYLLRMPRTGLALLLCEPLLEVALLAVTVLDLRAGAAPDWRHGLAAVYIGFTVGLGPATLRWADGWAAHHLAGGPRPAGRPRYGRARTVHEWRTAGRWILSSAVALALLECAVRYADDDAGTGALRVWQERMLFVIGVNLVIAVSYTLFPKREPRDGAAGNPVDTEADAGRSFRR
ncbi:hypothetical protein ACIQVT_09285 [Streptomyces sp. NPDC100445]|uniref:hypothetical protein n=1 Tax=Streptomyces sp. NPDC100445 TaxID=3366102 RepID=UPI0038305DF2